MAADKEAISLSRLYSYYSKCNQVKCRNMLLALQKLDRKFTMIFVHMSRSIFQLCLS